MHDETTTVTERGQVSIPARIRKLLRLKSGQKLHWQFVAPTECRVFVDSSRDVPGPLAALGYARKLNPQDVRSTDERMKELRAGEKSR
jgi:bifunctional DNA-binding transcriptional regulator/antitoxin component of YhaV-PrlF toxin-antitoxin module